MPGQPEKSEVVRRLLTSDQDDLMPPPEAHKELTARQKEILKQWVAQGAVYQKHWAYEAPVKAAIPTGQKGVDVLVQKRLVELGLKPSPEAELIAIRDAAIAQRKASPPAPNEEKPSEPGDAAKEPAKVEEPKHRTDKEQSGLSRATTRSPRAP